MYKLAQGICVFTMAVTGLLAQTTATTPAVRTRTSGIVGIAQGQTARFNVLNPAPAAPATATTATAACTAALTYYDASGALLKSSTVTVPPGTAGHLDLFSDVDLAIVLGQRRQIRVTVSVPLVPAATADAKPEPVCRLIGTLEIFDEISGRVEVVLGGMHFVRSEDETTPPPASSLR
jgi:hypothetical protein